MPVLWYPPAVSYKMQFPFLFFFNAVFHTVSDKNRFSRRAIISFSRSLFLTEKTPSTAKSTGTLTCSVILCATNDNESVIVPYSTESMPNTSKTFFFR